MPARNLKITKKFLAAWLAVALLITAALYRFGLAPQGVSEIVGRLAELAADPKGDKTIAEGSSAALKIKPRVIIPEIGVNATIVFPVSPDLEVLNSALTKGVVHYPGSAQPGELGNVFLFGHSTGLPVVKNRAYQAFNSLGELKAGTTIRIRYNGSEHWYRVSSVRKVRADAAEVDLGKRDAKRLVLSTCNVFGAVDDRFVVEAEFMGSYPLWSS